MVYAIEFPLVYDIIIMKTFFHFFYWSDHNNIIVKLR